MKQTLWNGFHGKGESQLLKQSFIFVLLLEKAFIFNDSFSVFDWHAFNMLASMRKSWNN